MNETVADQIGREKLRKWQTEIHNTANCFMERSFLLDLDTGPGSVTDMFMKELLNLKVGNYHGLKMATMQVGQALIDALQDWFNRKRFMICTWILEKGAAVGNTPYCLACVMRIMKLRHGDVRRLDFWYQVTALGIYEAKKRQEDRITQGWLKERVRRDQQKQPVTITEKEKAFFSKKSSRRRKKMNIVPKSTQPRQSNLQLIGNPVQKKNTGKRRRIEDDTP